MKQEKYDVVVIGSGVGGICSAALLAHAGYRTLVVERLPFLGGRFSTVEYEGFKCTTGVIGIQIGGPIEQVCKDVGAEFGVRPIQRPSWWVAGKFYDLPEKGGLRMLISSVSKDEAESRRVMTVLNRALAWTEPSDSVSFREWLLQYTQNEKILGIFQGTISSLLTVNDHELPAGGYFRFIKRMSPLRYGWAARGNVSIVEGLAKIVRSRGGEVWTHCPAKRIVVEDGIAKGVVIQKGDDSIEVRAKVVISNAGPRKTVELAGNENFDKGYLKQMTEKAMPTPIIWIHVASNRPLIEYSSVTVACARRVNIIVTPTIECPELAPPGKHLIICGGAPISSTLPFDLKKEIELNIADLREILPGFDRHAKVLWVSCFSKGWPGLRSLPADSMPQKTPVENLYNVGDGALPLGTAASTGSAESGRIVAEDVKSHIKPG